MSSPSAEKALFDDTDDPDEAAVSLSLLDTLKADALDVPFDEAPMRDERPAPPPESPDIADIRCLREVSFYTLNG